MRLGFRRAHTDSSYDVSHIVGRNWLGIALSFFLLVGGGISLFSIMQARPVNLRALSLETADLLSRLLDKTGIPPESIHQAAPVLTQDGSAIWNAVSFEVNVPETISPDGLASLVVRSMEQHGLEMKPLPGENAASGGAESQEIVNRNSSSETMNEKDTISGKEGELTGASTIPLRFALFFEHHEFIRVVLHETLVRDDLTPACNPVADAVQTFLETQGFAKERIQREAPKRFENERAIWTQTQFFVPALEGRSVDQLVPLLQQATASLEVEIAARTGINGILKLVVNYRGVPCVEVLFGDKTPEPVAAPETTTSTASEPAAASASVPEKPLNSVEDGKPKESPPTASEPTVKEEIPPADINAETGQPTEHEAAKPSEHEAANPTNEAKEPAVSLAETDPKLAALMSDLDKIPLDSSELTEKELGPKEEPAAQSQGGTPRVAIIVDDGGYGGAITSSILTMDPGLTVSIIPNTRHGVETARRAMELGFGVMLHLPMEEAKIHGELQTRMTAIEMEKALREALVQVPGAIGINNHMGSAFTKNEKAMECFLNSMKKVNNKLFFIDSRTTAETKATEAADKAGVRMASRDVFLDHQKTPTFMKEQFARLISLAKKRGHAIAICHFRASTAPLLAEMLPMLKEEGIQLVHVSELIP